MELEVRRRVSLTGHTDRVWSLAFSASGDDLASCSGDKTVRIWRREDMAGERWRCTAVLEDAQSRTIRSCDWESEGQLLASASFDATTAIWERRDGTAEDEGEDLWELVTELEGHENEVKSVAWSPAGRNFLATCSRDKSIWIWERLPGNDYECVDVKQGHSQDVKMVRWHPGGEFLVSASYDDSMKVWADDGDGEEWRCAQTLMGHSSTVWAIAFNFDGSRMVSCSDDRSLKVWACDSTPRGEPKWRCIKTLSGAHERAIYSVSWSHVNGLIATGSGDNYINLYSSDGDVYKLLHSIKDGHKSDVNCVCWHPTDPEILASAGDDEEIVIWTVRPVR